MDCHKVHRPFFMVLCAIVQKVESILPFLLVYSSFSICIFCIPHFGICIPQCEIYIPQCGFCIPQCGTENLWESLQKKAGRKELSFGDVLQLNFYGINQ